MRKFLNWAWDMIATVGIVIYACVFINEEDDTDE
jgi:hypothetical protein